jgi:cytochrome P450
MCNGLHLLLTHPALVERVRGDEDAVKRFVEEVLRLRGTLHFRPRIAQQDCEVAGARIAKGDRLLVVFMAGGRDEKHFADADDVAFNRRAPRDHLGFGFGPRTCVGMALARVELQEATSGVLERLDGLRLDSGSAPPSYHGFILRSYRPLHVRFTPTK